ncbi:hypothetical protein ACJ41O_004511 [Fusarium nematophilum]
MVETRRQALAQPEPNARNKTVDQDDGRKDSKHCRFTPEHADDPDYLVDTDDEDNDDNDDDYNGDDGDIDPAEHNEHDAIIEGIEPEKNDEDDDGIIQDMESSSAEPGTWGFDIMAPSAQGSTVN